MWHCSLCALQWKQAVGMSSCYLENNLRSDFFYSVRKCTNPSRCVTLNLKTSANYFDENAWTDAAISYLKWTVWMGSDYWPITGQRLQCLFRQHTLLCCRKRCLSLVYCLVLKFLYHFASLCSFLDNITIATTLSLTKRVNDTQIKILF
jgi:hypothetical protein